MEGANGQSKIKREIRFRAIKRIPIFERRGSDVYESMAAMDEWRREKKKKKKKGEQRYQKRKRPTPCRTNFQKKKKKKKNRECPAPRAFHFSAHV